MGFNEQVTREKAVTDLERSGVIEGDLSKEIGPDGVGHGPDSDSDDASAHKQAGVKEIEAITTVWEKKTLVLMMILLYLVSFVEMLLVSIQGNLNPYITSEFDLHGLSPVINIVSDILGGTSSLAIAKIVDIWGRTTGFMCLLLLNVIGNIIKATCQSIEAYAAGHTLYWVGHLGILYIITIMLSDMTSLKNRMLIIGINGTPNIAATFAGPKIAELFYENVNFRWAFGAFTIILVGFCIPVVLVMLWHQRKAEKAGLVQKTDSGRTWYQSIWHYVVELDLFGIVLITAGWALLLLPFNLATNTGRGWSSPNMIAMIVVGVVLLAIFVIWEKYFAPVQFFPFRYLKERTIIGACLLYGVMFLSVFIWDSYYYSYLQVVHDLSIVHAGYVLNAFSLTSSFLAPFIGFIISYTGNYKWMSYAGIPFVALGTGLLAKFRTPETHVGILVMCQVLNGIGTGIFAQCAQIAMMAVVTHQEIAVVLAIFGLFGSIGAATGNAIAGALWTNILPAQLTKYLPEEAKPLMPEIYGSFVIQQDYPMGSEIRSAIIKAYGIVQHKMVIAGSAFVPIFVLCVFLFKDVNVRKAKKQTKGNVF
ncbi:related to transporter (major facilitator superfamily) [Cephalotrichum gorgonifer]|uniref:Related to transporter (Major facilitator superfamily) n=1 Tax=Cephalotrichum gorgonifer TaxID=2041049 RepID=A0AAE8N1J2_9PEZI|nr:related to transporter (major facilitator superfamily) [Cephalotrichum gorgonifer]